MQTKCSPDLNGVTDPELAEVVEYMLTDLEQGPTEKLVEYYSLGKRVAVALADLGCDTGLDILRLHPNVSYLVTGRVTAGRILLLQRYLRARQVAKNCSLEGPTPKGSSVTVADAS